MKFKTLIKNRKELFIILSIILAVIIIAVSLILFLPKKKPAAAEHNIKNALPSSIACVPYLKNGSLYVIDDGQSVLISDGVYKTDDVEKAQLFDYVWSASGSEMLYLKNADDSGELMHYKNGSNQLIAKGVTSWCTVENMDRAAYIIDEDSVLQTGMLMLYYNGASILLDINVQPSSVRFSSDGNYLYALKCHDTSELSTGIGNLMRYDMQGNRQTIQKDVYGVNWLNYDGSAYVCLSQNADSITYDYLIVSNDRSVTIEGVYSASISDDRSVIYLLADYNAELELGTLYSLSVANLQKRELAKNVAFINPGGITDLTQGILYSTPGEMSGRYDINYVTSSGQIYTLISDGFEQSLYTIYLNTQQQTGYIMMHGVSADRHTLHYVEWSNGRIDDRKLDENVHELVYYEACDSILYIKNGNGNAAELYMVTGDQDRKLVAQNTGAIYNSADQSYYSCSLLSNDGKKALYFTNLINTEESDLESHPIASLYGTMHIIDLETGKSTEIAKQVMANAVLSIMADENMDNIYFMTLDGERLSLCQYISGEVAVLDNGVMNMLIPTM